MEEDIIILATLTTNQHPSMHHFASEDDYRTFVDELATNEAGAIEEWGAYEVANNVVVQVDERSAEI